MSPYRSTEEKLTFSQWLGIYRYNQEIYVIYIHEINLVSNRDTLYSQNI